MGFLKKDRKLLGVTTDPNYPGLGHGVDTEPRGMNVTYLISPESDRAVRVRPVLTMYEHSRELGGCGAVTSMGKGLSETYASNPSFYGATYCVGCAMHRPVGAHGEFYWCGIDKVTWEPGGKVMPSEGVITANKLKVGT